MTRLPRFTIDELAHILELRKVDVICKERGYSLYTALTMTAEREFGPAGGVRFKVAWYKLGISRLL